jgi:molybdopterin-guanine dinucleotide biosynthesis protein B
MSKSQKLFGISGWKNSGKTTLTAALIANLTAKGLNISSIKHAHHNFDVDQPGTDSFKHRSSGAQEVMLSSSARVVLMHEVDKDATEPDLADLLSKMKPVDVILVEGFKSEDFPKIQTHRTQSHSNKGTQIISGVVAHASDEHINCTLPCFDINDVEAIAGFILDYLDVKVS